MVAATEKKKRGRPPAFDPYIMQGVQMYHGALKRRSHVNELYKHEAISVLGLLPEKDENGERGWSHPLRWLADYEAADAGKSGAIKKGILVELGRLVRSHGEEQAREVAEWIVRQRPSVKEGAAMVRQVRLGRSPKGGLIQLIGYLERALDQFSATHPEVSATDIRYALKWVRDEYKDD